MKLLYSLPGTAFLAFGQQNGTVQCLAEGAQEQAWQCRVLLMGSGVGYLTVQSPSHIACILLFAGST